MDPLQDVGEERLDRFPRTRGDGPVPLLPEHRQRPVSPHTRGWTLSVSEQRTAKGGFPAHAGMDPVSVVVSQSGMRFPRTRGDGPLLDPVDRAAMQVSPHTRGWTPDAVTPSGKSTGFPAHAGMDPDGGMMTLRVTGFPRTRGDGPESSAELGAAAAVSPHTRGWTWARSPTRPRGRGFPAHAGMDPRRRRSRNRGTRFPRTRGDGPGGARTPVGLGRVSPHTRGWTPHPGQERPRHLGFPAHAGMDPTDGHHHDDLSRFPRTRGDGPDTTRSVIRYRSVSPHTRGWTRPAPGHHPHGRGFPAHAGMDPGGRAQA